MEQKTEMTTFDMVCRVFNPKYQPKKGESNEQDQKLR